MCYRFRVTHTTSVSAPLAALRPSCRRGPCRPAGSSWAAYGEFTLPKMYAEWDRVGQQLVAGQIDGKAAAKYLEEQRLKIHYNE